MCLHTNKPVGDKAHRRPIGMQHRGDRSGAKAAPATKKLFHEAAPSIGKIDYAAPTRDAEIQYC